MPFRSTKGIVSDETDPATDADVIMTAVILGFAAAYIENTNKPIRFYMDPLDKDKDAEAFKKFEDTIRKMNEAITHSCSRLEG